MMPPQPPSPPASYAYAYIGLIFNRKCLDRENNLKEIVLTDNEIEFSIVCEIVTTRTELINHVNLITSHANCCKKYSGAAIYIQGVQKNAIIRTSPLLEFQCPARS